MNWEMLPDSLKVDQNIQTRMQGWDKDVGVGVEIWVSPRAMLDRFQANNDQARCDAFSKNLDTILKVAQARYIAPSSNQADKLVIIQLDNADF